MEPASEREGSYGDLKQMHSKPAPDSLKAENQIDSTTEPDVAGSSRLIGGVLPRIHSLDAVRAVAMLLGLPMHATLTFYTPWSGIIDSSATPLAREVLSMFYEFFHYFRMQLFFLVAGVFAHLLCDRGAWHYLKNRFLRVGIPLVAGVLIALPLIEMLKIFGQARTLNPDADLPWGLGLQHLGSLGYWSHLTPHYLWFLLYLVIYYPAFLIMHRLMGSIDGGGRLSTVLDSWFSRLCRSRWIAVVMVFPTVGVQVLTGGELFAHESMTFIPTLTNLLAHGLFFGFGWFLFRRHELLSELARHWPLQYAAGAMVWLVTVGWPDLECPVSQAFLAWSFSFSLLGAIASYASGSNRGLRYLADSSYWLYLAHAPLLMFLQITWSHWLLPWWLKFPLLICALLFLLLTSYDLLVRGTWIGGILNGKRQPTFHASLIAHGVKHPRTGGN